jgi:hypothetical protein
LENKSVTEEIAMTNGGGQHPKSEKPSTKKSPRAGKSPARATKGDAKSPKN